MPSVPDPLSLPPEEMRRLGYLVVDRIVDHLGELDELPPIRVGDADELRSALGGPPPEAPGDPDAALGALFEHVLPFVQLPDHPRFFARIGSPSNYVSVLADLAAAGYNVFSASWTGGSGPSTVELVVLDWLRGLCGMPDGTEGVLTTGGSVATLVALAAARTARFGERAPQEAVAYVSSEGHAAGPRALRVLGVPYRTLTAGPDCRLRPDDVRSAVAADRAAGREPFCLVATAGTTSTGAVDPLPELADLCEELGLWLHVDGAYGAPAVLDPRYAAALAPMAAADSLAVDAHKWLAVPYEAGAVLVRDEEALRAAFSRVPAYLREDSDPDGVSWLPWFSEYGTQQTRGFRALKVWAALAHHGRAGYAETIGRDLDLAEQLAARVEAAPELTLTSRGLSVVTFRHVRPGAPAAELDRLNREVLRRVQLGGEAFLTGTELDGAFVLRACITNPRMRPGDTDRIVAAVERAAAQTGR